MLAGVMNGGPVFGMLGRCLIWRITISSVPCRDKILHEWTELGEFIGGFGMCVARCTASRSQN